MSKHFNRLRGLGRRALGLSSLDLNIQINNLTTTRDKLPTLTFNATEEVAAAKVLSKLVETYHLQGNSGGVKEGVENPIPVLNVEEIKSEAFTSLCAVTTTTSVIDSTKEQIDSLFDLVGKISEGFDASTLSTIINFDRFLSNSENYADSSLYQYFYELVYSGKLKIEKEEEPHLSKSYTYTLVEKSGDFLSLLYTPGGYIQEKGSQFSIGPIDGKENVFNVYQNGTATGDPVATITYNKEKDAFSSFTVGEGEKQLTYTLKFESGLVKGGKVSETTYKEVDNLVLNLKSTYEKNLTEYLPSFMKYQNWAKNLVDTYFSKLEKPVKEEGEKEGVTPDYAYNYSNLTNDLVVDLLSFGDQDRETKITSIETQKKQINIAVINLGIQNDSSKNILTSFGKINLEVKEETLSNLELESEKITNTIEELRTEESKISETEIKKKEQTEEIRERVAEEDVTFVKKNELVSIVSASDAHKLSLKYLVSTKIDNLIKEAAGKGLFNIELENITAIEVSLLLELGYVIEESTEPKKKGNKVVEVSTFTISWEDGNSFGKLS
jgi:hypothetical protein